ncbi:MAG: PAS domain-containing protein [Nitrospira sp.]|nr:PAS domain-containing protein [Nitrospira sp.]
MTVSTFRNMPGGWIIAAAAAAAAVFILDLLTPLGYAVPTLYVLPVLLTWLVPGQQSIILAVGSALGLTWLGILLSPGEISFEAVTNRTMASALLLVVAGLLVKQKQSAQQAADTHEARCESEERLRLAMEIARLGAWDWNVAANTAIYSPTLGPLFGLPPGTRHVTVEEFMQAVHPEDRDRIGRAITQSLETDMAFREDYRTIWPDGTIHWLSDRGHVYRNQAGKPVRMIGVILDITERTQVEEALGKINIMLKQQVAERTAELAKANERFEWVAKATHDGLWDWDLVGETVYFSPRWKEMHGFQETDNLESSQEWSERIHPEDRPRVLARLQAYWQQQRPEFWEEYRIRRKDGTVMWVLDRGAALWDEQGRAVRMVGAETDITWRKEAEDTLRRSAHEFRALADNVPALFSYIDRDRRYRFVNRRYEDLFGLPGEEIVGMSMYELLGSEGYAEVRTNLDAAFQGHAVSFEYRLPGPGATVHWFAAQYVPDQDEQGNVAGLFILLADITPLKATEAALREREAQLESLGAQLLQAQEEERRRIARELHDDFAQRLAALTIDLRRVCLEASDSQPSGASSLRLLGDSAEHLATDLQQMAHRLHPSILEHAGLEAAVHELSDEFAARTGLSTEVIVRNVPQALPRDQATCLYRVLQESLQNVHKHAEATTVLVRLLRTSRGLGLCVHDDGQGFESRQAGARRNGLGLTSMAERVGLVKGTFHIRTKPGEGTEVHVWVPLEDVKRDE